MAARACILGCLGPTLSDEESAFFRDADPWGFIVFARNIETPDQLRRLTAQLRESVGRNAPILIDQEGGRVARLRPPHWQDWTPALDFAIAAGAKAPEAMQLRYRLIAQELMDVGVDVNCAPMLDVAQAESHAIILNRCYGFDADRVAELGRTVANGLLDGGVLPIIKHVPGHGRASLDSHLELPVLDTPLAELQATDFQSFAKLADQPMAMTAHIIYTALDGENCATHSKTVINAIRDDIGFRGLLMTDDLSMNALQGDFGARTRAALAAGCDMILHCNGERAEMEPILAETPVLAGQAAQRADAALAMRQKPKEFDAAAAHARLAEIFGGVANG